MLPLNLNQAKKRPYGSPMELRTEDGKVEIIFPAATKWVRLTPEQAEEIGHKLVEFSPLPTW